MYANSVAGTADDMNRWIYAIFLGVFLECVIWLMNLWIMNYFTAMNDILQCGVTNAVDSKYGKEFYDGTFAPAYAEIMDAASFADMLWHPAIHYPVIWMWFLYMPVWWAGITLVVGACLALPWCFTICPGSILFCIGWCLTATGLCLCVFPLFCCYWLPYWAVGWAIIFSILVFPWFVPIGIATCMGWLWCYWVFLVGTYGVFQLLMAMDYAQFWTAKGAQIGGVLPGSKAAGGDDAGDDDA